MPRFDLVCKDCRHSFMVVAKGSIKRKQKRCPECSSDHLRQTLSSYMRHGSLANPRCGAPRNGSYG